MAVVFDAAGAGNTGKASSGTLSVSWIHNSVAPAGLTAVVGVVCGAASNPNPTVTFGGVTMTQLAYVTTGAVGSVILYGLLNAPAGSVTVTVSQAVSASTGFVGESMTYTGAGSFGTVVTATVASGTLTISVPANAMSAHVVGDSASSLTGYSQTQRYTNTTAVTFELYDAIIGDSAATGSVVYNPGGSGGSKRAQAAVPILPAVPSPGQFFPFMSAA